MEILRKKSLSTRGREPSPNSTHTRHQHRDMNPDQIGGRRVLSPTCHHYQQIKDEETQSRSNHCCSLTGLGVLIFCPWVTRKTFKFSQKIRMPDALDFTASELHKRLSSLQFASSMVLRIVWLMTGRTAKFHLFL